MDRDEFRSLAKSSTRLKAARLDKMLTELKREEGISETEFAERIGCGQRTVSKLRRGETDLSVECAKAIVMEFPDCDIQWLLGLSGFASARPNKEGSGPEAVFAHMVRNRLGIEHDCDESDGIPWMVSFFAGNGERLDGKFRRGTENAIACFLKYQPHKGAS